MTNLTQHYLDNANRFSAVVESIDDWEAHSPCENWSANDVVDHVVDTQRDFLGKRGRDLGDRPAGPPPQVWQRHLEAVSRVLTDREFVTSAYDGYFGPTTVEETLANFYGFDLVVHRWDLGTSNGRDVNFDDAEMDMLAESIDGFGDSLYSEGICKPAIDVPDDASRQDRLLGRLGRDGTARRPSAR